jgi:predicted DNA repair protein MutK
VLGFAAQRELPIVGKIAVGSLRNKLLILLPATLAPSYLLPWMITPLLMFGGAYLCFFLTFLGAAGTAAMIWVGGGIILHGLEAYGAHSVGRPSTLLLKH